MAHIIGKRKLLKGKLTFSTCRTKGSERVLHSLQEYEISMTTEAGLSSFILLFCLLPLSRDASTGQLHQPVGLRHEEKQGPPPLRVQAQISACMDAEKNISAASKFPLKWVPSVPLLRNIIQNNSE